MKYPSHFFFVFSLCIAPKKHYGYQPMRALGFARVARVLGFFYFPICKETHPFPCHNLAEDASAYDVVVTFRTGRFDPMSFQTPRFSSPGLSIFFNSVHRRDMLPRSFACPLLYP